MATNERTPAAQYLRMSTESQQYSMQNQADAVARYAIEHGFAIVKTYSDAAKLSPFGVVFLQTSPTSS